MIRVLIVDDHSVMRRGLHDLLSATDDIEVVATASDGHEGVADAAREAPDVVLMDLLMPTMDGVTATAAIVAARPETKVVVLTSFADRERIVDAVRAGACGYLLKDADPDEVVRAVRAAAGGDAPFSPRATRTLLELSQLDAPSAPRPALTRREEEVLGLVAEGLSNKAIARRLSITEATVKTHLTRIFSVIGVTSRTQAAAWVATRSRPSS